MTDNSRKVFNFLKENKGSEFVHKDIVAALGLTSPQVTGSVNGLVKKGYAVRREDEQTSDEGKKTVVKYISLTDAGFAFDPDAKEDAE